MHTYVYLAVVLILLVGFGHSYLGERYVLRRIFQRCELPELLGSVDGMHKVLRFGWHIASLAWIGLAAVLVATVQPGAGMASIGAIVGATFFAHFLLALVASRGRHLSWIFFLAIALLCAVPVLW
jgi:hypothetical protein